MVAADHNTGSREWIRAITRQHINAGKMDWFEGLGIDLIESKREGCYLWDLDGRCFLDALCDGSTYTFGHRHPALVQALIDGLEHYDIGCQFLTSKARAEFANLLIDNAPQGLRHVHLLPSGSEANDAAIKAARLATGKRRIVVIDHAFHGTTGLSVQASGAGYAAPYAIDTTTDWIRVPWNDLEAMAAALSKDGVAAVLLETIPATLGWPLPDDDYLPGVRHLCDQSDVLLIVDEVQTGYGRLGALWGIDLWNVIPDMLVMAKGAGGGLYPLAFVLLNDRSASWIQQDPLSMPSTFGGSELGCTVGKRALELVLESDFLANVHARSAELGAGLNKLASKYPQVITEIRHLGLAAAIRFATENAGLYMMAGLYQEGVLSILAAHDQNVIQLKPPLIISKEQVAELLAAIDRAVSACFVARSVRIDISDGFDKVRS